MEEVVEEMVEVEVEEAEEAEAEEEEANLPLRTGNHATFSSSANGWSRKLSRGLTGARCNSASQ